MKKTRKMLNPDDIPDLLYSLDNLENEDLNPILPFEHLNYDNIGQPFLPGGLILANLDAVFNFSDMWNEVNESLSDPSFQQNQIEGLSFLDLSRLSKGSSEYWLWRNSTNTIVADSTVLYKSFRKDINYDERIQIEELFLNAYGDLDVNLINRVPDSNYALIGSSDPPKNLREFVILFCSAMAVADVGTWVVLPLPNDRRVTFLQEFEEYFNFTSVIRIVSSPYPWFVVQMIEKRIEDIREILKRLENDEEIQTERGEDRVPLPLEYWNLRTLNIHWKIPSNYPEILIFHK